jgi:hypothetical protein
MAQEQPTELVTASAVGPGVGQSPAEPLSLRELGELLVRHHGLREGIYEVTVEFNLGVGAFGPSSSELLPTAFASLNRVGLRRVADDRSGPGLIDAAALRTGTPSAPTAPPQSGKAKKMPAKKRAAPRK